MIPEPTFSRQLNEIKDYTFEILDKNSDLNIYNTISRIYRIEKNIQKIIIEDNIADADMEVMILAHYMSNIVLAKAEVGNFDIRDNESRLNILMNELSGKFQLDEELSAKVKKVVLESLPFNEKSIIESKIMADATIMDFACVQGRDRLKQMYEQMFLKDSEFSKNHWYDILISILESYKTTTNYGQTEIQPIIESLHERLSMERDSVENQNGLILKNELKISDLEIQKLKGDLIKAKNKDYRGIQTLFRNTSRNHYTLNTMVDAKAKIMITINSIILSLILGGVIGKSTSEISGYIPFVIFALVNLVSVTFAILSIAPNKTQGNFTEEEIRNKKGNLLYFGNFFNMHYRDFEWAFLQMLNDKDYLYTSMIRDYYYQGQILQKKYFYIRISLYTFLFGLGLAILSHFVTYLL